MCISQSERYARCTSVLDFHSKNLQNHVKTIDIGLQIAELLKIFGKFFRSYSELLSTFFEMSFQGCISEGISYSVFFGDLVYKMKRVKGTANFVSPCSWIVKRLRRRKYDPRSCAWPFYRHVQICPKVTRQLGLYDGTCPNLLRRDKALIFVPSDCYSRHHQSLDLSSLPDRRSYSLLWRMSLYNYFWLTGLLP